MVRRHGPILRTAGAASAVYFSFAAFHFDDLTLPADGVWPIWFLAGFLYTNLFEYWVHRFPMHRGLPLLRNVRRNHIEHHRIFHGANFRTRNPGDLAHISGRFWLFPLLFAGHYALLTAIAPIGSALAFLTASFLHYLAFEVSHWLTHLEDNAVDHLLARIPLVASIRAYQIQHHRIHHQTPVVAFNFNPPYLGDVLLPRTPPRPVVASAPRTRLLYGTALVLGIVALGIAAFAHPKPPSVVPPSKA
jgi:hypothetical protein